VNYLLDTDVCIGIVNETSSRVRTRFAQSFRNGATLAISSIVVHELWYGVAKSRLVAQDARALAAFLGSGVMLLDYTERDAQAAGEIRAELERQSQRIGEYDTLIAGQAFSRNLVLVTANTSEFNRVKGLIVENWAL
jgi:tRNA(fMet)-specific endonuclease VapC